MIDSGADRIRPARVTGTPNGPGKGAISTPRTTSTMPTASIFDSPNRRDSGPVSMNWQQAETRPVTKKQSPTSFGCQWKRP